MTLDESKIDEAVLALLHVSAFSDHRVTRARKSLDWDALDRLHSRGLISDPRSEAKFVVLTDEGAALAAQLSEKHFGAPA